MSGIQQWVRETVNVKMPNTTENLPLSSNPGKIYGRILLFALSTVTWVSERPFNSIEGTLEHELNTVFMELAMSFCRPGLE